MGGDDNGKRRGGRNGEATHTPSPSDRSGRRRRRSRSRSPSADADGNGRGAVVRSSSSSRHHHRRGEGDRDRRRGRDGRRSRGRDRDDGDERRQRSSSSSKRKKKSHRHGGGRRSRRRDQEESSSDDSSTSSSSSSDGSSRRGRRKRERERKREDHDGRRRKKDKKKRKRKEASRKRKRRRDRDRVDSDSDEDRETGASSAAPSHPEPPTTSDDHPARQFAEATHRLLARFPEMADGQLTSMLLRMASGTTFDLNQVTHPELRLRLDDVFRSLSRYGVARDSGGSWGWEEAGRGGGGGGAKRDLVLVKIARVLLDQVGVTMEAVEGYEQRRKKEEESRAASEAAAAAEAASSRPRQPAKQVPRPLEKEDDPRRAELLRALSSLLEEFGGKKKGPNGNSSAPQPSLEAELCGLFTSILDGEVVILDGLPDANLKRGLEGLFDLAGLEHAAEEEEIDEDGEEGDENGDSESSQREPTLGYALPEIGEDDDEAGAGAAGKSEDNVKTILKECQRRVEIGNKRKASSSGRIVGPSLPPPGFGADAVGGGGAVNDESSSSDESGPAPAGSDAARRRDEMKHLSKGEAERLARKRRHEMDVATGKIDPAAAAESEGGREEWMMNPGEHSILEGIMRKPASNRQFRNEKTRAAKGQEIPEQQMSPAVRAEMDQLMREHADSRGPSLVELHRERSAKEREEKMKASGGKKADWKWTRDKDLDAGRRVDKDALGMIMGGADENLKTKFSGGFSRGFM